MRSLSIVLSVAASLLFLTCGGCQTPRAAESAPASEKTIKTRGLSLSLRLDPVPVRLSETRRLEATIRLKNSSPRFVHLEFPTTQRFEMLVRDPAGKLVVQWSEDQVFQAAPGYVGVNPGESVEYHAAFATRDLQPGKRYIVTVFFPARDDLKLELPFVPGK